MRLKIEEIEITDRRALYEPAVLTLAESIREVGLINPIQVTKTDENKYQLCAGLHRLRACQALGMDYIEATDIEADDAELIEIDENLERAELNAIDRARLQSRKVQIIADRIKASGAYRVRSGIDLAVSKIADDGTTNRGTLYRDLRIDKLSDDVKAMVENTWLADHQQLLYEISLLSDEQQVERVRGLLQAGQPRRGRPPASEPIADKTERSYERLVEAWTAATDGARERFVHFIQGWTPVG